MKSHPAIAAAVLLWATLVGSSRAQTFAQEFEVPYGNWNVFADDVTKEVKLQLVEGSGAQIQTSNSYVKGQFSARVKLVQGDSSGVVAAFYLTSIGPDHDEIDFELLGNETGQPLVVHTNLFVKGVGSREQRSFLWFDPTLDFHTYTVVWNEVQILWLVDNIPIRRHRNKESQYPNTYPYYRPMVVAACIFDASTWATRGGQLPVKYELAPFVVTFSNFAFDACKVTGNDVAPCANPAPAATLNAPKYGELDSNRTALLSWVRKYYLIYDYCYDTTRYATPPVECALNA